VICKEIKWLFPKELHVFNTMCIMFKLQKGVPVSCFKDYFVLRSIRHKYPTSSAANGYFDCNFNPKTSYGYASFYYKSITVWNDMPMEVRDCATLYMFKKKLKEYLLNQQICRLGIANNTN